MTKRILLVLLASLTIGMQAFAQTVSGKVADANGEAIPGASVLVKGTTTGTMTDLDGAYQLAAGSNATLVFSCIGYQTQEVAVAGKGVVNVVLTEDSTLLEETVVVAYGTAKRKDLTGSISTVDGSNIAVQAQGSVTRALEGQVAGLQTSSIDGQPGWDMGIRIRGLGTANANYSNALVIIDGAPANDPGGSAVTGTNPLSAINSKDIESITVLKDAASTALYGSRGANGVILITTKSGKAGKTRISFEARMGVNTVGANGYFSKVGDNGTSELYEAQWAAIRNAAYFGKVENGESMSGDANAAAQFASQHLFDYTGSASSFQRNSLGNKLTYNVPGLKEGLVPTGSGNEASATMNGAYLIRTDGKLNPSATLLYDAEDIQSALIVPRFRQEYNVSASGATDKLDYHMSLGYLSDPSYISTSKFERLTARANVNAQITSWLKAGAKFAYTHRTTNSTEFRWAARNAGRVGQNPFNHVTFATALDNVYAYDLQGNIKKENGINLVSVEQGTTGVTNGGYTDSPIGPTSGTSYNRVLFFDQTLNSQVLNDLDAKGYLKATFLKYFTAEVNVSYDIISGPQTRYYNVASAGPMIGTEAGSQIQKIQRSWTSLNTQQLINYNQDFGKHHVDAMIGHEYNQFDSDGMQYGSSYSLIDGFLGYANFLGNYTTGWISGSYGGTNLEKTAMESYIGRANYIYDDKYYVSASIRRDGSSKFKTEENRWGTFWSVGAGWRISSEPWMEGAKGWLDNLKIRASYGVIGNQNGVGNYSGYQTWSYTQVTWKQDGAKVKPDGTKLTRGAAVNDNLTWEKVNTADAGVDFTLFGGKLAGSIDWFNKQTNNSIFAKNVSYLASGQNTVTLNSIGIRSTGIELDLSYQPVKTKDWDVILSTNGTHYTTTLTSVPEGYGSAELGGCSMESAAGWTVAGTGGDSDNCYLRGVGKDYYNLYMQKYAGVAGNPGLTYWGTDGKQYTGYTKGDPYAGDALFYHTVTAADVADGLYGGAKAGDMVRTTDGTKATRYELGSAVPAWIGGFTAKVRYKGFDFTAMLGFQIGGKFLSIDYATGESGKYNGSNAIANGEPMSRELIGNTWSETNQSAKFPMIYYANGTPSYQGGTISGGHNYTDLALFDASYLSLKNVTLGYTFPSKWMNKAKISNLRIYVSADNSLMAYAHSGVDPRRSLVGGVDLGAAAYPALAVYSFGVNLDF